MYDDDAAADITRTCACARESVDVEQDDFEYLDQLTDVAAQGVRRFFGRKATPAEAEGIAISARLLGLNSVINPAVTDSHGNATPELHRGGYTFRPGDKVMQIRNNYDKEVFNGDIGTIRVIDPVDRTLTILFDDRSVDYDVTELDEIVLAYATTVHKAQGAESSASGGTADISLFLTATWKKCSIKKLWMRFAKGDRC